MSEYRDRWIGNQPIFLLSVTWGGFVYRFATKPIALTTSSTVLNFDGHLNDPEYTQKSRVLGADYESLSVPFALFFDGINIADEYKKGNVLDSAPCELAYVLDGETDYDERVILATGRVSQPIFGYPERSTSYVEFALESEAFVITRTLIDGVNKTHIIDDGLLGFTEAGLASLDKRNFGKTIPIVFGRLKTVDSVDVHPVPLYYIGLDADLSDYNFTLACHKVMSTSVECKDGNTETDTGDVLDAENLYSDFLKSGFLQKINERSTSYVAVDSSYFGGNITDPLTDDQLEYWGQCEKGLKSPFGDDVLEGGGDVCMWALTSSNANIDYAAWYNLRQYLNQYKFAGVINDETITGLAWLQEHILPYLPVEIILSKDGLAPRLNMMALGVDVPVADVIEAGAVFYRLGPMTPMSEPSDIINEVTVRFAWDGARQSYISKAVVQANIPEYSSSFGFLGTPIAITASQYAVVSQQVYGAKTATFDLAYVYDRVTAFKIALDMIRFKSMPTYVAQYAASPEYGFLQLGDVIELTDLDIAIDQQKAQVIAKRWNMTHWVFDLKIEHNHIANVKQL
jgi:hypothetical protein